MFYIAICHISTDIRTLEADLGVELIVRENRKFSLTPAGEYFYRHSLLLLDEVDRLKQETNHIAKNRNNRISIGYCKSYGLQELQQAIAVFSEKYSNIDIQIINGNHEELYQYLKNGDVSLVINDQRRALSDEYFNYHLCTAYSYVEIAGRSPLSNFEAITIEELKRIPCILVASKEQQENEREYYQNTLGFAGNFLFAEDLEEGRLLVAGNKGFLPVEGSSRLMQAGTAIKRLALFRNGNQIQRNYFAFWKKDKDLDLIREFADILRTIFQRNEME